MKKLLLLPIIAALMLAGCSPTQYIISTKTGALIQANSKPRLDSDSGLYTYKNADGKEGTINKDDVTEILER